MGIKINMKVLTWIALGAFVVLLPAKLLIESMSSFIIICVITGVAMQAVYYSFCDMQGNIRPKENCKSN